MAQAPSSVFQKLSYEHPAKRDGYLVLERDISYAIRTYVISTYPVTAVLPEPVP